MRARSATYGNGCPGFDLLPRTFRDWRGFFVRGDQLLPHGCRFAMVPFDNQMDTRVVNRLLIDQFRPSRSGIEP